MRYDSSSAIKRHRARPKIALDSNYRPFCSTVRGGGDVSQFAIPGPDVIVSCGLGPGVPLPKPHCRSCSNVKLKSVPKQVGVSEGRDVKLSIKSTYCFSCRGPSRAAVPLALQVLPSNTSDSNDQLGRSGFNRASAVLEEGNGGPRGPEFEENPRRWNR